MSKNINIFVYGSLRENFFNYDKYLRGRIISIKPAILHNMVVYHMPYKGYPAILPGEGKVVGEVVTINPEIYDDTIVSIDEMEGFISENNPKNEYHKKLLEVELIEDGAKQKCYTYFYNGDIDEKFANEAVFIKDGDWAKHMSSKK